MKDYPSNSRKKVSKVVNQPVKRRKKSVGSKVKKSILSDDSRNVGSYILGDVLLPAVKSLISDMVSGGVEMLLFGDGGSKKSRRSSRSRVSYNSYYDHKHEYSKVNRKSMNDFDDIILETRGEAEEVISHMCDLIDQYDVVSVADLYDLVGAPTSYTDNKYGWDDLSSASVKRIRGGYLLDLPRTVEIE